MTASDRAATTVMAEAAPMLAFNATAALYEEQPELWSMGERGRAKTLEDFGRHFESLASLDPDLFTAHVRYCETLFDNHGFPRRWLTDAWRIMAEVIRRDLPPPVAAHAVSVLKASEVAAQHPA